MTDEELRTDEEWRDVPGYEGLYAASSLGRIRSLGRRVRSPNGTRRVGSRVLRQCRSNKFGHLAVSLCKEGQVKSHNVHRLVAAMFLGDPPDGLQCCHNDGDPTNNAVDNLRWGTPGDNQADRIRHGTYQCGEQVASSKLTASQVACIKSMLQQGKNISELSRQFGVSRRSIRRIKQGEAWSHVAWHAARKQEGAEHG